MAKTTSYGSTLMLAISGMGNFPTNCANQSVTLGCCLASDLNDFSGGCICGAEQNFWRITGLNALNGADLCLHSVCSCTWVGYAPTTATLTLINPVQVPWNASNPNCPPCNDPPALCAKEFTCPDCNNYGSEVLCQQVGIAFVAKAYWDATNGGTVGVQAYFYDKTTGIVYCEQPGATCVVGQRGIVVGPQPPECGLQYAIPNVVIDCAPTKLDCGGSTILTNNQASYYQSVLIDFQACNDPAFDGYHQTFSGQQFFNGMFLLSDVSC